MSDPLIAQFGRDCGATAPIRLRVEVNGGVLVEGGVRQPFALIGRDDACDVSLDDPEVNLRHAWIQVVAGRPFLIDLGSRKGVRWPTGLRPGGWLDVDVPVGVGPFQVRLTDPVSGTPPAPKGANPLRGDLEAVPGRPAVSLEFRNGRRPKDSWVVNRPLTLVGRAADCKIHLNADDISSYHCGLVHTAAGLWVVDLSGRGVVVNGERMRVSPLPPGAELWIGRFLVVVGSATGVPSRGSITPSPVTPTPAPERSAVADRPSTDPTGGMVAPPPVFSHLTPLIAPLPFPVSGPPSGLLSSTSLLSGANLDDDRNPQLTNLLSEEDEVPLGVQPLGEANGLPSSHIMADAFMAFHQPGGNGSGPSTPTRGAVSGSAGPVSGPISVAGTLTPPRIVAPSPSKSLVARTGPPSPVPALTPTPAAEPPSAEAVAVPLLRQLGEVHGQMFEQFQHSMLLVMQMFQQMHRDQMTHVQHELTRIQELNAELVRLQGEVARLALAQAFGGGKPDGDAVAARRTDPPALPPDGEAVDAVFDRINALQQERQSRWHALVGKFTAAAGGDGKK